MRKNLLHHGSGKLSYEIREIVGFAKKIEQLTGKEIIWENIGDPIEKKEKIPNWIKNIVKKACDLDEVYAYSPTKGLDKTIKYLKSKNQLKNVDIIFFNGLGDAINKIYKALNFSSRIIGPNPAYSTHSSAEAAHAGSEHITYKLDPKNNWNPDLEELENKVKYNPNIVGILVINPDNPTGAVFKKEILVKIIKIAKKYNLFVIFDEIYEKITYNKEEKTLLSEIIGDIPGISMKGMSKDIPWPGSRCGWLEIYNKNKDKDFSYYIDSILASKMLEVCSTTLPQYVLPEIYENPNYTKGLQLRINKYQKRAKFAKKFFENCNLVTIIEPKGAFYLSIIFNIDKVNTNKKLKYKNEEIKKILKKHLGENYKFDKYFCYNLIISKNICVVPLSSFNSSYLGFRMTLLENDFNKFQFILKEIKNFLKEFNL